MHFRMNGNDTEDLKSFPRIVFDRCIRAAKPRAKKYDVWDDVISGLGLCVIPTGIRSFFLRRMVALFLNADELERLGRALDTHEARTVFEGAGGPFSWPAMPSCRARTCPS